MTASDVARHAGVSQTTVSFVINETPGHTISAETRQRVLGAVEELGYTPNSSARALRRGRNDLVLFALPDLPLASVIARTIDALSVGLAEHGLSLVIRRPRTGEPLSAVWRGMSPSAVVVLGGVDDADAAEMQAAGVVVTEILLHEPTRPTPSVVVSQDAIGRLQVEHLRQRGCQRIGYLAPSDPRLSGIATLRIDGARQACRELGLPDLDVRHAELSLAGVLPAVDQWSRVGGPATGVAAYNDQFGGAVLAALDQLGRRAPHDLAVIGVDNDPMGAFTSPPLTTIDQLPELAGARLAAIIAAELAVQTGSSHPDGDATLLVIRASS